MMAQLRCTATPGMRDSEVVASFEDFRGRVHFIRVERDFLSEDSWLPVGIVHVDPRSKLVLVELPHEAETGANRLWVKAEQLDEAEALA